MAPAYPDPEPYDCPQPLPLPLPLPLALFTGLVPTHIKVCCIRTVLLEFDCFRDPADAAVTASLGRQNGKTFVPVAA